MRYWIMRLFLTSRERPPLLERMEPEYQPQTRQDYLRAVFGTERRFEHRKGSYVFKPFPSPGEPFMVGVIGRERTVRLGLSPEERFQKKEVPDWQTANVFLDVSGDPDGQKVGVQEIIEMGRPLALLRSFVDHVNSTNSSADWVIAVNAITREESFWTAVERHRNDISEISLTFVTPNIWGGESETEKALRRLHTDNNAQEVEVKLFNKDKKLRPDSADVRSSTDYIGRGGGRSQIKSGSAIVYNSEDNAVTENIRDDSAIQDAALDLLMAIIKRVLRR